MEEKRKAPSSGMCPRVVTAERAGKERFPPALRRRKELMLLEEDSPETGGDLNARIFVKCLFSSSVVPFIAHVRSRSSPRQPVPTLCLDESRSPRGLMVYCNRQRQLKPPLSRTLLLREIEALKLPLPSRRETLFSEKPLLI